MKRRALAALLIAQATSASVARADAESCAQAYESAQRLQRESKLLDARRALVECAQDACPAVLRQDCVPWLAKLQESVPRISVSIRGKDGCDRSGAEVLVDGVAAPSVARGLPLDVDPGPHEIVASLDGSSRSQPIVVAAGERQRLVTVTFAAPGATCGDVSTSASSPPTRTRTEERPPPRLAYVLGAVGIGVLAVGAGFGISAWSQKGTLDDCRPSGTCAAHDVDTMRHTFLAADVLGGIGLATLAAATVVWFFVR